MALVIADRVKETTTVTTGTATLLGAATGFQSFAVIGNGNTTYYCIAGQGTSEWEVGIGTYTSSGTTLARTTILSNSAGTQPSALSFSVGTKDVFVTYPSAKSVNLDASGNATALGTPSSGTVTNLTGTASININGTVGATTASSVSATTIVASNLLTQAAGADIASAATINLSTATGNGCRITGTTAISAVTMTTGQQVLVVADGALPLTYNATTNKLNSAAANVTLAAGDMVLYSKDLSGIVHGNIIKANGTSVVAAASSPISTPDVKTTGTAATFTIPTGVTTMKITVQGGGGAAGTGNGCAGTIGAGGGSGGTAYAYLSGLTPGNTITYTVGGAGGTSSISSGTQTITTVTCTGGGAGSASDTGGVGGAGGSATNGTLNLAGSRGDLSGAGGSSQSAGGGGARGGYAATSYGSGGGGGITSAGGSGFAGIIIFEY